MAGRATSSLGEIGPATSPTDVRAYITNYFWTRIVVKDSLCGQALKIVLTLTCNGAVDDPILFLTFTS